jgi:hypothetical protein
MKQLLDQEAGVVLVLVLVGMMMVVGGRDLRDRRRRARGCRRGRGSRGGASGGVGAVMMPAVLRVRDGSGGGLPGGAPR